jgi:hypothetical protein
LWSYVYVFFLFVSLTYNHCVCYFKWQCMYLWRCTILCSSHSTFMALLFPLCSIIHTRCWFGIFIYLLTFVYIDLLLFYCGCFCKKRLSNSQVYIFSATLLNRLSYFSVRLRAQVRQRCELYFDPLCFRKWKEAYQMKHKSFFCIICVMLCQMRIDSYRILSRSALRCMYLLPPRHVDEPLEKKQCSAANWFS